MSFSAGGCGKCGSYVQFATHCKLRQVVLYFILRHSIQLIGGGWGGGGAICDGLVNRRKHKV